MNGVLGMLGILLETELDDQQKEYASIARSSARNLLALLNDLLDFSKIEAGKMDVVMEPFPPRPLVEEVARLFHPRCSEKGLALHVEVDALAPDTVVGDSIRVRQVLVNLLGNAVKFTESGTVSLRLAPLGAGADRVLRVTVADTGIGIDAGKHEVVFEAFTQGDGSITRRYGGTGLGLAISRRLIRMMGGDLALTSSPGAGSTFSFDLPAPLSVAPLPPCPEPAAGRAEAGGSLRVLVAEDNPVNQMIAAMILRKAGHEVQVRATGLEALAALGERAFDVVLMDMQMPDLDGIETTLRIRDRELETGGHVRIVAVTGNAYSSDRDRCFAAGMDAFLSKPFDPEGLLLALRPPLP
jgi:CheY-like chemotaxis protein